MTNQPPRRTQQEITSTLLREQARTQGLAITETGLQRKRPHGSVQRLLEARFGKNAITPSVLRRIFNPNPDTVREPNAVELALLAQVLNVPKITLEIDMSQPCEPTPLTNYTSDMARTLIQELSCFLGDDILFWKFQEDYPIMYTAIQIDRLEQYLEQSLDKYSKEMLLDEAPSLFYIIEDKMRGLSRYVQQMSTYATEENTYYPISEQERYAKILTRIQQECEITDVS